jgi:hypothetical protein
MINNPRPNPAGRRFAVFRTCVVFAALCACGGYAVRAADPAELPVGEDVKGEHADGNKLPPNSYLFKAQFATVRPGASTSAVWSTGANSRSPSRPVRASS